MIYVARPVVPCLCMLPWSDSCRASMSTCACLCQGVSLPPTLAWFCVQPLKVLVMLADQSFPSAATCQELL